MQTLRAVLGGKVVSYPMTATFVVERRAVGERKFSLMAERTTISDAITKFSNVKQAGFTTRLRSKLNGKFGLMIQE